jgi:hypothetical protein
LPVCKAPAVASPTQESDRAELSTVRAQVEDLTRRVIAVAEHYDDTADSAVAADLFAAERSLSAARRQLDRASAHLES